MNPEVKTIIETIGQEQRLLLSGFAPTSEADIAAAIVRIAAAAASAYLLIMGRPIDESLIKTMETLTEADLPQVSPVESDHSEVTRAFKHGLKHPENENA